MNSCWSRRDFLKSTAAAMFFSGAEKALGATQSLPKRRLGKTGEIVSCIGFGSGTRFCSIPEEDAAQALLERALALGVSYFDTAGSYTRRGIERLSEKRLGEFSKKRRKEIFLATKIDPRDRDGALRSVEQSLKFLQTDYLDLIQIHSLSDLGDLDRIGSADSVLAALRQLKEQGVARFIGCEQLATLEQNIQAALNFTPISESDKQKLREKVAPSRSAWQGFLQHHDDSAAV